MLSGTKKIFNALSDSEKRSCIFRKMKHATLISIPVTLSIAWVSQGIRYAINSSLDCESVVNFGNSYIQKFKFNCHFEQGHKSGPNLQKPTEYKALSYCANAWNEISDCNKKIVCCWSSELNNVITATNTYIDQERSNRRDHAKLDFQNSWPLTFFAVPVSCIIGSIIGLYLGYQEVNSGQWILEHEMKYFPFPIQKLIFEYIDESLTKISELRMPLLL